MTERSSFALGVSAVLFVVFAFISAIVALVGATWSKTDAVHVACVYNGGPLDGRNYRGSTEPGSGRQWQGMFSQIIEYPINVRQYDASDGLAPIRAQVRGIPMTFSPSISFTISSKPDEEGKPAGCDLIEKHLRPLDATDFDDDESRWASQFLNVRIQRIVLDVGTRVLQKYDPTALTFNTDGARDAAAAEISSLLTDATTQALGGSFFCAPDYEPGDETCGDMAVLLPEPTLSEADAKLIAAPQRARTEADNEIAVAREAARKAEEVAEQKAIEADSAEALADAQEQISEQQARVNDVEARRSYAWCAYLVELNQDCALVKAAEGKDYPDVVGSEPVVAVPAPGPDDE